MSNLSKLVEVSVRAMPMKECIADSQKRLTYKELQQYINGTQEALLNYGILKNDRIGIHVENSAQYIILYLSILSIGAIIVPLDPTLLQDRLDFIISDCKLKLVIYSDFTKAEYECPSINFVHFTRKAYKNKTFNIDENNIACINYTTGSTGNAKGVVLTHQNVFASIFNITSYMEYANTSRELIALPLTHSFGLNQVLVNLFNGGFVYLMKGFLKINATLRNLEKERITTFPGTPTSFKMYTENYYNRFSQSIPFLHTILINSSPLSADYAEYLLKNFPRCRLLVYYGLTEASRSTFHTHSLSHDKKYLNSVGKASPNVDTRIINERIQFCDINELGEVVVKAKTVMKEYWNNPDETSKVLIEGWFRTGDLGFIDENGFLFLTGRLKDQINIGGYKTTSKEIIDALISIPFIEDAFVWGKKDSFQGEVPVACVVSVKEVSIERLLTYLDSKLESFKIPQEIYQLKEIPASPTGKVLKAEVLKLINEENKLC